MDDALHERQDDCPSLDPPFFYWEKREKFSHTFSRDGRKRDDETHTHVSAAAAAAAAAAVDRAQGHRHFLKEKERNA